MPCYLLVRATTVFNSFVQGQTPTPAEEKGGIVEVRHALDGHGAREGLPTFVRIYINDANMADLLAYGENWRRSVDWNVLNHDASTDTFQLEIVNTNPGATNRAAISRADVENFLTSWGGVIQSDAVNSVVVNISVFDAMKSVAFWGNDAAVAVQFSELDYSASNHTIQADYTGLPFKPGAIEKYLLNKGATIVSHDNSAIVFTMARNVVVAAFKEELQVNFNDFVQRNRFKISQATVDNAIANGGELNLTLAQVQSELVDDSA